LLASRVQLGLQPGLLLRARAQLRSDRLTGLAVGGKSGLELHPELVDPGDDRLQVFDESRDLRAQCLVPDDAGSQAFGLLGALGSVALGTLRASPLGPQLGVEESAAAGARTLVRRGPAALDRGDEPSLQFCGLVALDRGRAVRRNRVLA